MILTKENITSIDIDILVNEKIKSGNVSRLLLLVPTNRKARNLKKEIISGSPGQAASGINIETLGTLAVKLLNETKPFRQLSEAAASVFIKKSASETELHYFSQYKDEIPFGTLDRIKNVISEYKRQGITPDVLRREAEKLEGSEKNKAADIADIYENYLSKSKTLNAFETGDVYQELNILSAKTFHENFSRLYPEVELIVAVDFSEFSIPEIIILDELSTVFGAKLFLSFDYSVNNDFIFYHLTKTYQKLEEFGFRKIEDKSPAERNEFINLIRENLFKTKKNDRKKDYKEKIVKISGYDKEKEIDLIAREIKNLILEKKAEPHNICVVFNLIDDYSSIVKDIFTKNGLPFNLTDRAPLDNSNPVTAIVNFLEIIENDFYFKNIFRALSSGFVDVSAIDVANLYRISSELKIVAGKENWINTLKDSIANLPHTGDDEDLNDKHKSYSKALSDIKYISELLSSFEDKLSIPEFHKRLQDFIVKSKLPFKLLDTEIDREKNIRAFTEFIETISEIFMLLTEESGKETKFSLKYFVDQIRTACGWARFNVKEKSNYGVQVTTFEEIRGLKFDYLFIGGLYDGNFPTRYNPEIFFSGSFRKQSLIHQTEERYRVYQTLCTWNKQLYLTFPMTQGGKETVVSTFLKDFEELCIIIEKNEDDYEDAIYSKEDLLIAAGRNEINLTKNTFDDFESINSDRILKAIEIDKIRNFDPFGESVFTGNILSGGENSNELVGALNKYLIKQYSISQLETYAKCPFKFFLERVLGIETIEEPTEDIEAIEMGRLLHSILFEFYSAIRNKNIVLGGCDAKIFASAEKLIYKIAEEQLKTTAFKSPLTFYEKEKLLGLNGDKKQSILYQFLEAEREGDTEWIPKYFEVSFGRIREGESDEYLSDGQPVEIDGINLRGKVDRVELNEKTGSFNVVDYKLGGTKPTFDDLKDGISLQLPVYLYAVRDLFKKKFGKDYSPNEIFIYSLKYAVDDFGKKKVASSKKGDEISNVDQLIESSIRHIKNYITLISQGKFNLSKLEDREAKVCRFCQFRTICRIDEVK